MTQHHQNSWPSRSIQEAQTPTGEQLAVVPLAGRLASHTASEVRQLLHQIIGYGYNHLLLDLGAVTFIDSSGIGVLISALKKCRSSGGNLCLCNTNQDIKDLLELTSLMQVLNCFDSIQSGIEGFPVKSESSN